jgi:hypothetical protein
MQLNSFICWSVALPAAATASCRRANTVLLNYVTSAVACRTRDVQLDLYVCWNVALPAAVTATARLVPHRLVSHTSWLCSGMYAR